MIVPPVVSATYLGVVSVEPIRLYGFCSVFEGHPTILPEFGELHTLLVNPSVQYLLLDLSSSSGWLEVQAFVRRARPDIRQIVLGPAGNDELVLQSIAAGARAYLDPNAGPHAIRIAVESVMQGSIWAPRRLLSILIDRLLTNAAPAVIQVQRSLSPRERQVLDLIMVARSNREIAVELGIEERTVKSYVASLLKKSGVDNRVALYVQATQDSMRESRPLNHWRR